MQANYQGQFGKWRPAGPRYPNGAGPRYPNGAGPSAGPRYSNGAGPSAGHPYAKREPRPGQTVCDVCNIVFAQQKNAMEHFNGKRHKLAVEQLSQKKADGVDNNDILNKSQENAANPSNQTSTVNQAGTSCEKADKTSTEESMVTEKPAETPSTNVVDKTTAQNSGPTDGKPEGNPNPEVVDTTSVIGDGAIKKTDEQSTPMSLMDITFANPPSTNTEVVDLTAEEDSSAVVDARPAVNPENQPEADFVVEKPVRCELCDITFKSAEAAEPHFIGRRHAFALEKKADEKQTNILSKWQGRGPGDNRGRGGGPHRGGGPYRGGGSYRGAGPSRRGGYSSRGGLSGGYGGQYGSIGMYGGSQGDGQDGESREDPLASALRRYFNNPFYKKANPAHSSLRKEYLGDDFNNLPPPSRQNMHNNRMTNPTWRGNSDGNYRNDYNNYQSNN